MGAHHLLHKPWSILVTSSAAGCGHSAHLLFPAGPARVSGAAGWAQPLRVARRSLLFPLRNMARAAASGWNLCQCRPDCSALSVLFLPGFFVTTVRLLSSMLYVLFCHGTKQNKAEQKRTLGQFFRAENTKMLGAQTSCSPALTITSLCLFMSELL